MFESIIKSIQNSAEGWRMFFGGVSAKFSGDISKSEIGGALIGTGFAAAQQRYVGIKAGQISAQAPGESAPVGVRYIPATLLPAGGRDGDGGTQYDPGTPASVVERIQKSISNSAEGWRMGFASAISKAQTLSGNISERMLTTQRGVEKGFGDAAGGVGDWIGKVTGASSLKWLLYIVVGVLIFVAIMTSIGYSGVGAPAARIAEREYVKRR